MTTSLHLTLIPLKSNVMTINVTLLGVNIDFMLRIDDYVSEICGKASKQLAVVKRLRRFLTKQGKMTIYNSFYCIQF